jgi:hypothetical protein
MKLLKFNAFIFLTIIFPIAAASEWAKIAGGESRIKEVYVAEYIDVSSIKKLNSTLQYWRKTVLMNNNQELLKGNDIIGAAFRYELFYTNCTDGKTGLKQLIVENNNNFEIYKKFYDDVEYKIEKPGSSIDHSNSLACHLYSGFKIPTEKTQWKDFKINLTNGFTTIKVASNTISQSNKYTQFWIGNSPGSIGGASYYAVDCIAKKYKKIGSLIDSKTISWLEIDNSEGGGLLMDFIVPKEMHEYICTQQTK